MWPMWLRHLPYSMIGVCMLCQNYSRRGSSPILPAIIATLHLGARIMCTISHWGIPAKLNASPFPNASYTYAFISVYITVNQSVLLKTILRQKYCLNEDICSSDILISMCIYTTHTILSYTHQHFGLWSNFRLPVLKPSWVTSGSTMASIISHSSERTKQIKNTRMFRDLVKRIMRKKTKKLVTQRVHKPAEAHSEYPQLQTEEDFA